MARIKDGSVDEVKAAADIVAVISARTPLRKAGARFVGRCPFHEERTPSFSVNPTDKLYYCFGCGARCDREAGARRGRRRKPRRPRAATSGDRAGRRLDGNRVDGAAAARAVAVDAEDRPLLRR